MRFLIFSIIFLFPLSTQDYNTSLIKKEQLIVFIQKTNSEVGTVFSNEMLSQIQALAEEEGLEFILQEVNDKAPKAVTYTPFIAFRDDRGVSYFSGRWNQLTKIKNFIRSTRVFHQENESNDKENVLTWQWGRMKMIAPLKITDVQGVLPKKHNAASFQKAALEAIEKGTQKFEYKDKINATLSTRSFYWAMYPFRDKKGKYHITGEIYSQYNCVDPIYTHFENPVIHKDYKIAFQQMAAILEEQTVYQLDNPKNGDGFGVVENKVKHISWDEFGSLDSGDEEVAEINWDAFEAKTDWKVVGAFAENTPLIYFKFMQPLDGYTGEVTELEGTLNLKNERSTAKANGKFKIPITAITMGDPGLDDAIHTFILDGESHPMATFQFEEIEEEKGSLANNSQSTIIANGEMELKGKKTAIQARGTISPYMKGSKSYLHANLQFAIDKSDFGVEKGPDGPDEIKEKMMFYMNFLMD